MKKYARIVTVIMAVLAASAPAFAIDQIWHSEAVSVDAVGKLRLIAAYEGWIDPDSGDHVYQEINVGAVHPIPHNIGAVQLLYRQYNANTDFADFSDSKDAVLGSWMRGWKINPLTLNLRARMHYNFDDPDHLYRARAGITYKFANLATEAFFGGPDSDHAEQRSSVGVSHKIGKVALSLDYVYRQRIDKEDLDAVYFTITGNF